MYTAFYGLREKPFALSPDPRFLYLAGSHREALAHLLYGIEEGEGFISVTGEVGTGKTTLCRTLLERLDGDTELAFLFNPSRTALELLQSICAEFDLPAEGLTRRSLMTQLDAFLVEQKKLGRRVLLIIDEAQTLTENTLEQVRLLSNLETSREKLIQILLLGQPELDRKLDERGLRQLRQRISVRWKLEPLSPVETRAYVRHRLSVAAGEPKDLFTESALREIHRRTGGIPRLVNQLCDRALLAGYAARAAQIRPGLIRAAAREIPDARRPGDVTIGSSSFMRPWMLAALSVAIVGVALFAGLQVGRHGLIDALRFDSAGDASDRSAETGSVLAESAPTPPAVGANAPTTPRRAAPPTPNGDTPLARGIGFVPTTPPEDLRPTSVPGAGTATPDGVVSAVASLEIPKPNRPEITALSPGLLGRLLAGRNRSQSLAESERAVLEGFGRPVPSLAPPPNNIQTLRASLERSGLTSTPFDGGSIELLRRLDHPVLLPLSSQPVAARDDANRELGNPDHRWFAIVGFEEDRASLAGLISNRLITIPIDELEDAWLETGVIVWERYDELPAVLAKGAKGESILWLQNALTELEFYEGGRTGLFDDDTFVALTRFQRERGLVADGVVGPLTQIALYGQLERYPVPRLSRTRSVSAVSAGATPPNTSPNRADLARERGDRG